MRNTFLYRVYQYDRKLFLFFAFFGGLTLFFNLRGDEVTPFFVWVMYSKKENTADYYEIARVTVNDSALLDYSSGSADHCFFLRSPLEYYKRIRQNHGIDPAALYLQQRWGNKYAHIQSTAARIFNGPRNQAGFMDWYARYIASSTYIPLNQLQVDILQGHFAPDQSFVIDSCYLLSRWKKN